MTPYGWILFAHVGAMGDGNSNALTVAEFSTQQTCMAAGQGSVKSIEYAGVRR